MRTPEIPWLEGIILLSLVFFAILPLPWKRCIKIALFLVVFEGAIRKWLVPGLSQFVYFGKDALILAGLLKYSMVNTPQFKVQRIDPLLNFFCICSGVVVLLQAGNDALGSPVIGVMGARNYLLYVPLLYLTQYLFDSQDELVDFLKIYLPISVPVCILSLLQHFSPPDSPLNVYVSSAETAQGFIGANVRATGTFSYIAGYAAYLQTMSALILPMLVIQHSKIWKFLFRLTLGSVLLGILFTGSRGPVVVLVLFLAGYFIFNRAFRALGLYRQFLVPLAVGLIVVPLYFSESVGAFGDRFTANQDIGMRILASFTTPIDYMMHSGMYGYGAGATYQANDKIRDVFGLPDGLKIPVFYESEPERVMLELGPVGFFLWYLLRLRIVVLLWSTYRRLTLPLTKELALTAFLIHILFVPGQVVFQITFTVYYWFLAGFILLLPRLEKRFAEDEAEADFVEGELSRKMSFHTRNDS